MSELFIIKIWDIYRLKKKFSQNNVAAAEDALSILMSDSVQ